MITHENLKEVLESLDRKTVQEELLKAEDWILLSICIFNTGFVANVESRDYEDEIAIEAGGNGDVFIDKDEFLRMSSECGIEWD